MGQSNCSLERVWGLRPKSDFPGSAWRQGACAASGRHLAVSSACLFYSGVFVHAKLLQPCLTPSAPWTLKAHQAPLSMGFSRQEYRSGLQCSPPGDLHCSLCDPFSSPSWFTFMQCPSSIEHLTFTSQGYPLMKSEIINRSLGLTRPPNSWEVGLPMTLRGQHLWLRAPSLCYHGALGLC